MDGIQSRFDSGGDRFFSAVLHRHLLGGCCPGPLFKRPLWKESIDEVVGLTLSDGAGHSTRSREHKDSTGVRPTLDGKFRAPEKLRWGVGQMHNAGAARERRGFLPRMVSGANAPVGGELAAVASKRSDLREAGGGSRQYCREVCGSLP